VNVMIFSKGRSIILSVSCLLMEAIV